MFFNFIFIVFYSVPEITELYARFSKKLGPNQYHLERNNNPSNGFYTYTAAESGDIFTTRCTDQLQVHRMYIDALSKHAEGEADTVLREIATDLLRKDIIKKAYNNCTGCAVDDPSQKNHTCLLDWPISVDRYFEDCYNGLSRELLVGLYAASQLLEDGDMVLKDKYVGLFLGENKSKIQNLLCVEIHEDTLISCFIEGFFEQLSLYIK